MPLPTPLSSIPRAFQSIGQRVNALIDWAAPWDNLRALTPLRLTKATLGNQLSIDLTALGLVVEASATGWQGLQRPFKAYLFDSNPSAPKIKLIPQSYLMSTPTTSTSYTITDLTTAITLSTTTKVWLKGTVNSSLALTGASITTINPTNRITRSGTTQTEFHIPIGRVVLGSSNTSPGFSVMIGSTQCYFEQFVNTHLACITICDGGYPAIYPFPCGGGPTA